MLKESKVMMRSLILVLFFTLCSSSLFAIDWYVGIGSSVDITDSIEWEGSTKNKSSQGYSSTEQKSLSFQNVLSSVAVTPFAGINIIDNIALEMYMYNFRSLGLSAVLKIKILGLFTPFVKFGFRYSQYFELGTELNITKHHALSGGVSMDSFVSPHFNVVLAYKYSF